jgi:hypothetical protein
MLAKLAASRKIAGLEFLKLLPPDPLSEYFEIRADFGTLAYTPPYISGSM